MKNSFSNKINTAAGIILTNLALQCVFCAVSSWLILIKLLPKEAMQSISIVCTAAAALLTTYGFCRYAKTKPAIIAAGQGVYLLYQILVLAIHQLPVVSVITITVAILIASAAGVVLGNLKTSRGKNSHKWMMRQIR